MISCSMILSLIFSVILSFHNTAWFNIKGQLPLMLKRRLYMHGFTKQYSRTSKLSVPLLKLVLQVYGIYFGVFGSEKIRQIESLKISMLDLTLTSCVSTTTLLLALRTYWGHQIVANHDVAVGRRRYSDVFPSPRLSAMLVPQHVFAKLVPL